MVKASTRDVDTRWSWVIAFSCCFINFLLYGIARLSGLLMVAALETFQISRASAALPFSISTSIRNLSGIFVGYLGQRFGLRAIIATGCLLASLGAGLCFFISDITWFTVCWGGIFGTGFGLATCLLPLAINQHFDKHRGAASGISYSGSYIGSFVFPPLLVVLLDEYGFSGAFIVISATFLNGLAVAMLFRAPPKTPQTLQFETNKTQIDKYTKNDISDFTSESTGNHFKRMWHQLLHKIKSNTNILQTKTVPDSHTTSSGQVMSSGGSSYKRSKRNVPDCELVSYIDLSLSENTSNYPSDSIGDYFTPDPKLYLTKSTSFFVNPILKRKHKIQFRKNLLKVKKILIIPTIRRKHSLTNQFSYFPFDEVKLISFRNLYCVFCSDVVPSRKNNETESFWNILSNRNSVFDHSAFSITREDNVPIVNNCSNSKVIISESQYNSMQAHCQFINQNNDIDSSTLQSFYMSNIESMSYRTDELCQNHMIYESSFLCNDIRKDANVGSPESDRCFRLKEACKCLFGWFRLYGEPMYVVIAVTIALQTFVIVCMITIIEDFAKDIGIPDCQVHYVLMVLSISDLLGSLTLGVITDRRILSRCHFIVLCFLGMCVCLVSISFSRSITSLLTLVAIYGIFESGVIITFPLLIAHFIPLKKQAIAVASSNILSSPTVLLVPLAIGYFRDRIGCYSGVFYCLAFTSLCCSIIWLIAPHIFTKQKKKWKLQTAIDYF